MSQACSGSPTTFFGRCLRPPTVERDGKPFCWQHDPERRRKKAEADWERRKAEIEADDEEFERKLARRELEAAAGVDRDSVGLMTDDQLRDMAAAGGLKAVLMQRAQKGGTA